MRVDAVVVGVNLLDKVGVHLVKHLLDEILARLLPLLTEDAADDVPAVVEIDEAGGAQFRRPFLARRHCGGILGEGLLVVVVPKKYRYLYLSLRPCRGVGDLLAA